MQQAKNTSMVFFAAPPPPYKIPGMIQVGVTVVRQGEQILFDSHENK